MKTCSAILLILFLCSTGASALTHQDETTLSAGMNCYENNQWSCAIEHFEKALSDQDSGMNSKQRQSINIILYSLYFTLAQEKSNQGSFDDIEKICDKGIALGIGLGRTNDDAFKLFHVWYTIALMLNADTKEAQALAIKLQQVQQELTSSNSDVRLYTAAKLSK